MLVGSPKDNRVDQSDKKYKVYEQNLKFCGQKRESFNSMKDAIFDTVLTLEKHVSK